MLFFINFEEYIFVSVATYEFDTVKEHDESLENVNKFLTYLLANSCLFDLAT